MDIDLEKIAADWPSPFVARSEIEKFTKGLYKARSMNTLDGSGKGIKRKIKVGSKVSYLKQDIIDWIKERKRR